MGFFIRNMCYKEYLYKEQKLLRGRGFELNFLRGTNVLTVGGALMHHAVLLHSSPSAACGEMLVIENLIENPIGNPIIGPNRGIQ